MPLETSAEKPTTVRTVARLIGDWVDRLGAVWVEGQLVQVSRRPGAGMVFLTLRDPSADISVTVTCSRPVLDAVRPPVAEGSRVVVFAKPRYYIARGTLSLSAKEIRPVGEGELLARLAHLRQVLTTEGLFDADRKRPLPFLPRTVGLVCGRASAAEKDVVENARRRWPAVEFAVREVAVQGPYAVAEVLNALRELDADPSVDVIVIARGGGSLEDLLPFSDESLVRAVAAAVTPVVSAIGHERDEPLLDLVADVRASTPTDAARRVVPDVAEELGAVTAHRDRAAALLVRRVTHELQWLATVRTRPSLADPLAAVRVGGALVGDLAERSDRAVRSALDRGQDSLTHTSARLRALSPQATLDRGYAIVQRADATIVRSAAQVDPDERLRVRVAEGGFDVTVAASP